MSLLAGPREGQPGHPAWLGIEPGIAAILAVGLLALVVPLGWEGAQGTWSRATQGHEPLVLAIAAWLAWRQRAAIAALEARPARWSGAALLLAALLMYLAGRTFGVFRVELLSLLMLPPALLLYFRGYRALRQIWFACFFTLFAVPLPFSLVLAVTGPMKEAVSYVAAQSLSAIGYPIGLSGVVITIGQYQLLVNEACAGLQTMFTLEAMGLLYASLMNHSSALRNTLLALLVVPIAFCANVVRVMVLALVTYHLGDAAGQGFLHGFAGMVLFLVALVLVMVVDALLGRLLPAPHAPSEVKS